MPTRVFVVHMLPSLASRFFKMAKAAEMMSRGYAWIVADALTSLLDSVDSETIEAMQGVIGVKGYIPRSNELHNFQGR
ncbi:Glutamate receptor 2.1 [Sesamum angolense]|uniref:Glutamate receptor 2.1 n=1 Tax=Sesamum angolense TaxID=2727404 RepID=A0AAE2BRN1_9LAMI|nr:Glutamate receptor 2.1 [Sesamum angolense]